MLSVVYGLYIVVFVVSFLAIFSLEMKLNAPFVRRVDRISIEEVGDEQDEDEFRLLLFR